MANGPGAGRQILVEVRQALRQSKLGAVNPAALRDLFAMCDQLDEAYSRRQGSYDRFERDAYLAADEEVRRTAYALGTAVGRLMPDLRPLAERLANSESQAPRTG